MGNHIRPHRSLGSTLLTLLALGLILGPGGAARGQAEPQGGGWTVRLEPAYLTLYGHDQHVLTVHEIDLDAAPATDEKRAVALDTDSGPAYRGEVEYGRGAWDWGLGFFWFSTSQNLADQTATAGGPVDRVAFEVADRTFASTAPGEVLFFRVLEDTDVALWTADLYAARTLAETPRTGLRWRLGVRVGDFDNDYRAVVGIENVAGRRLDASSNYDRMTGPLLGLDGVARLGRSTLAGYFGQSVLIGSVELTSFARELTGPFGETPAFTSQEVFRAEQDVAIPITELRIRWTYGVTEHIAVGAGLDTAAWWDVPVPPGAVPGEDGQEALHENTLVLAGAVAVVEVTF